MKPKPRRRPGSRPAFPAVPAALVAVGFAAACAAPLLATGGAGADAGAAAPAPVVCGVSAVERAGMVTFRPWLRAEAALSGDYRFTLARAGTLVEQGGAFAAAPGARVELGEAMLPGPATGYEVRLGVTAAGIRYTCRGDADET